MADFSGQWESVSSENNEAFFRAVGMAEEAVQKFSSGKTVWSISHDGDNYSVTVETPIGLKEVKFKLGEEFDEISPTGKPVKSVVTMEGVMMKHVQKAGDVEVVTTRHLEGDKMIQVMKIGDVTSSRTYKKIG